MLDYIFNMKKSYFSKKQKNEIHLARKKKKAQEIKNRIAKLETAMKLIYSK